MTASLGLAPPPMPATASAACTAPTPSRSPASNAGPRPPTRPGPRHHPCGPAKPSATKGAPMPSERTENRTTRHALGQVFDYISPGTNEGISFALSRLTDDLFTDSFLGGGDITLFTPSAHRGSI